VAGQLCMSYQLDPVSLDLDTTCGYGTSVGDAAVAAAERLHGFVQSLTSFVGRAGELGEVAGLLDDYRLVTVTGPGGVGKTRLAGEVARRVASQFADGVWLVELAAVSEPALVSAAVAVAVEVHQPPGMSIVEALAGVLARRQLLLVLDNCEHVTVAVAQLCGTLLPAADDVRVLATSREPLGIAGEARYRLPPLALPGPGDPTGAGASEAVALFADRARQADAHFALGKDAGSAVARLVTRLDGMPLAIELAAARVESLGVAQLLDRIDDRFVLLADGDRLAAPRQRSLAATVEWSYRLLGENERSVFRRLAVFPGPFTLEAAEAVAGSAAGPVVLHLVDCSLLTPPRAGPDGRARYLMLETLRAYGLDRLAEACEQPKAGAALARHALHMAEQAAAGLQTRTGELEAARWLDAEDVTTQQALAWALDHDPPVALRLAIALAPWWQLRGRTVAGYALLRAAAEHAAPGSEVWCTAQVWLGRAAKGLDFTGSLAHFTAARDVLAAGAPSPLLVDCLVGGSGTLVNLGRTGEGAEDARRALALAREIGDLAGEAGALVNLSYAASRADDFETALTWAQQAQQIDSAAIPGSVARKLSLVLAGVLADAGEVTAAQLSCADGLALARHAGDVYDQAELVSLMALLDLSAGRIPEAGVHLQEAMQLGVQTGNQLDYCLDTGGRLCAAMGRWAEAVTLWAAYAACLQAEGIPDSPQQAHDREEPLRKAAQALGPARMSAAEERGAAMTLETATELAIMLTIPGPQEPQEPQESADLPPLSARERELVTLVAQGRTDAQIAAQLYISVSTVRSHLERIRDKSGCRRRADLTRLALQVGLV
jgi:predicted ATPase/DNA-binding CsgD family transcriptional regulator